MSGPSVVFVAPSAYTLSGLATWLDYLIPGLRALGWDARLGLVGGPRHHLPEVYLREHPNERALVVPCSTGTPEGRCRAMIQMLETLRPHLVASVNIPDVYAAVRQLRNKGRTAPKCVMTCHGIGAELVKEAGQYSGVLDAVVATNRLACRLLAEHSLPAMRVLYAPYGVSVPSETESPCGTRSGKFRVLYSGRLESEQKRVHDIPKIMGALANMIGSAEVQFAGGGPSEPELRASLERVGGLAAEFLGILSPTELAKAYRSSDALLVTSSWETGPIVIWEAMANGLPVVSSRYVGSGLEGALVDGENCLLFDVGDIRGAAEALARLAGDAELAQQLRRNALDLIRLRYSREASVAAWDKALRVILGFSELPMPGTFTYRAPAGRLDRWMGPAMAESIRELLGRTAIAPDPGGEWPHSHVSLVPGEAESFMARAAKLDRVPVPGEITADS